MKLKKIIKIALSVIFFSIIGVAIYLVGANIYATKNNTLANFFGYSISYVPTKSMEPTIESGSTILIKKSNYTDAKPSDIIVYYNDELNIYVIHRIKRQDENGFIMQGDNNPTEDYYKNGSILYVTEDNFYGSYVKTLNIFNLKSFGNGKGLLIFVLVVGASMLVIEGFSIANAIRDSKKEKEAPKIEILDDEELKKKLKEEIKKEILNGKDK